MGRDIVTALGTRKYNIIGANRVQFQCIFVWVSPSKVYSYSIHMKYQIQCPRRSCGRASEMIACVMPKFYCSRVNFGNNDNQVTASHIDGFCSRYVIEEMYFSSGIHSLLSICIRLHTENEQCSSRKCIVMNYVTTNPAPPQPVP